MLCGPCADKVSEVCMSRHDVLCVVSRNNLITSDRLVFGLVDDLLFLSEVSLEICAELYFI